ncbi:MAG TPA: PQQ-dependent sugar dehydrogenase [Candidatus Binatia bacterium]|nr:PQQ-dependent sugar dehydrogenase [Candidatus Binatia bacterium]
MLPGANPGAILFADGFAPGSKDKHHERTRGMTSFLSSRAPDSGRTLRAMGAIAVSLALLCGARESGATTALLAVRVAQGLSMPLFVTSPPGDTTRLFIVEQRGSDARGRIQIRKNGSILGTPFLTTGPLAQGSEQGLLGLAFAPDYATSGRFYIDYTDSVGDTKIERHSVSGNPDVANPAGAVILSIRQPYANHNGGWLGFGPDGYLYVSMGDGGSGGDPEDRAQNVDSLLGKILRLDVSGSGYTIPPGNPFAGGAPGADEIWAFGLRNPWRPSFDRQTGDLVIADVGQSQREEIDFAPAGTPGGVNYGWRCFEGSLPYASSSTTPCGTCAAPSCTVFPAYEYDHSLGRCAITGGYVYRGCAIPDLRGRYFFGDYCGRQIYSGRFQNGLLADVRDSTVAFETGVTIGLITSFGEDARGELYITDQGGQVFKVMPKAAVLESDMPALHQRTALGDTLGSTSPGNALATGITPFADAGSRIRGVGYLRDALLRDCTAIAGSCLTARARLAPFDIDLLACVDSAAATLTRRFVFTNTAAPARPLAFVDVVAPRLRGDPNSAVTAAPAGSGHTAVLVQADAFSPDRWIVHSGSGSIGVAVSADVDTASQLAARVAADQPLGGGTSAGPASVGMALGFDFGSVAPAQAETVTVVTRIQASAPSGVALDGPWPAQGGIRVMSRIPFQSDLRLEVALPRPGRVALDVFDTAGRRVRALGGGSMSAGRSVVSWDGKLETGGLAPSGIYFIKLRTEDGSQMQRVVLVR